MERRAVELTQKEDGVPLVLLFALAGAIGGHVPNRVVQGGTVDLTLDSVITVCCIQRFLIIDAWLASFLLCQPTLPFLSIVV